MGNMKSAKALLILFFVCLPCCVTGLWHTLLPDGPVTTPQVVLERPKPLVPAQQSAVSQTYIVQPHAAPLQPTSEQEFQSQLKSPAVTQQIQTVSSTMSSHPQSSGDQIQSAPPQYGYPANAGFPQPVNPQQMLLMQNIAVPPFVTQLAKTAAGLSAALSSLGLTGMPDISECGNAAILKETMICVQNALEEMQSVFNTGKEIVTLNARVMSGGRKAETALQRLKTLSSKPYAKLLMKVLGTTMVSQMLMQRESTPDRQRWQAGSVITLVTDIPVTTVVADSQTGSFGHINVVLPRPSRVRRPDKLIRMLDEGIDPVNLPSGPMTGTTVLPRSFVGKRAISSHTHMYCKFDRPGGSGRYGFVRSYGLRIRN